MDGVTILRCSMVLSSNMQILQAVILVIALAAIATGVFHFYKNGLLLIIAGAFLLVIGIPMSNHFPSVMRYEVTVSDDVKFNEFNEKYKIIEINNDVITVEEQKNE